MHDKQFSRNTGVFLQKNPKTKKTNESFFLRLASSWLLKQIANALLMPNWCRRMDWIRNGVVNEVDNEMKWKWLVNWICMQRKLVFLVRFWVDEELKMEWSGWKMAMGWWGEKMAAAEGGGDEMVTRWDGGKGQSFCRMTMAEWPRTELRKKDWRRMIECLE